MNWSGRMRTETRPLTAHRRFDLLLLAASCTLAFLCSDVVRASSSGGVVIREGVDAEQGSNIKALVEKALRTAGVGAAASGGAASDEGLAEAQEALAAAEKALSKNRFADALDKTEEGLAAFEKAAAYNDDERSRSLGRDLLVARATAALSAKKKAIAEDAAQALLVLQPRYEPPKRKVSKPVLKLFADAKKDVKSGANLSVQATQDGLDVVLDGKKKGKTPLVLEKLAEGVHYVAVNGPGGARHTERIVLKRGKNTVTAEFAEVKGADLTSVLAAPASKGAIGAAAGKGDVVAAAVVADGDESVVALVRVQGGEVARAVGVVVPKKGADRAIKEAVTEVLSGSGSSWVGASEKTPADLDKLLFAIASEATGAVDAAEAESEDDGGLSPIVIGIAAAGGVAAVLVLGGVGGYFGYREFQKGNGFTWSVDASKL